MPGATLLTVDGDEFTGSVKVKVGPITVTYKGKAKFAERDDSAHRAVIEASGRETRGSGTASATVNAVLTEAGSGTTKVSVVTDLNVTGRPAQFGRGVMEEVGAKLVGQFANRLAEELASPTATGPADAAPAAESATASEGVAAEQTSPAKKTAAKKTAAKKTAAAKTTPAKKTAAAKTTPAKATAAAGTTSAASEATAKTPTAKKSTAKKTTAKKTAAADTAGEPAASSGTSAPQRTSTTTTSTGPRIVPPPARPAEPIDLLDVAGESMAKRLVPIVAALVVVLLLLRRRRRH
jgi:carbon monoxide dehydrogenase subunit G